MTDISSRRGLCHQLLNCVLKNPIYCMTEKITSLCLEESRTIFH